MDDVDAFTETVIPLLHEDIVGLHNGDLAPRMALWSPNESATWSNIRWRPATGGNRRSVPFG